MYFECNPEGLLVLNEKEFDVLIDTEEGSPANILLNESQLMNDLEEQDCGIDGHISPLEGVNNKSSLYRQPIPHSKIYYMETQTFRGYKFSMQYYDKPDINSWLFGEDADALIDQTSRSFLRE